MLRFCVAKLCALYCLWLWSLPAYAQSPDEPAQQAAISKEAALSETLRKAIEAYDAGDLLTARALFEAVHRDAPTARTLRSLGLLAFREERFADAVALLEASLASTVKPLTEAQREAARSLLTEARDRAPSEPVSAAATIAPAPIAQAPAEQAPAQAVASAAASVQAKPVPAGPTASSSARTKRLKRAAYTLLAVGAAALILSGASYLRAAGQLASFEDKCRSASGCTLEQARRQNEKLDRLTRLSLASGIVGGLATSGAIGMLVLPRFIPSERSPSVQLVYRRAF